MNQIVTVTVENTVLAQLFPDFDIHGRDLNWVRKAVKQAVENALNLQLVSPPTPAVESGSTSRINFSLASGEAVLLKASCREHGSSDDLPGYAGHCRGLLHALAARPIEAPSPAPQWETEAGELGRLIKALNVGRTHPYKERSEQALFYVQLRDTFAEGKVALAEAATGVGKSVAILAAGIEAIRQRQTRMLIAVPTLALVGQYQDTHQELQNADSTIPPLRLIFGRQEFISQHALAKFLIEAPDTFPDRLAVESWVSAGSLAPAAVHVPTNWLRASLQELAPQFPVDEVRLNSLAAETDAGNMAYHAQFDENRDQLPEIMVCSHAMAAIDMQRRIWMSHHDGIYRGLSATRTEGFKASSGKSKTIRQAAADDGNAINAELGLMLAHLTDKNGMLPAYQLLVVDEAHQFEANASMALSSDISLREIVRNMQEFRRSGGRLGEARIDEAAQLVQRLSDWGRTSEDTVFLGSTDPYLEAVKDNLRNLHQLISNLKATVNLKAPGQRALELLRRAANALKIALNGGYAYLQYSPARTYPQLLVGCKTVENVLSLMWNSVEAGAAVSATLYLNQSDGFFSGEHHRRLLAIPLEKLKLCTPVVPLWLLRPVKEVWTVEPDLGWLTPPKSIQGQTTAQYDKEETRWLTEVATALHQDVLPSAVGGTLILMTSLKSREKLELMLFDLGYSSRLISTVPGISLLKQREVFLHKAHDANKPIWLAVGGAWTGLDVGGHTPYAKLFGDSLPAGLDNVLTDLVIPRVPFRMNRSITHAYRVAHKAGPWEIREATFLFLQALGRLVRREGVPSNRRVWVLDARLNSGNNGYGDIQRALSRYLVKCKLAKPSALAKAISQGA